MMLQSWDNIFNVKHFNYARSQYSIIREIMRHTPDAGKIIEMGYGTGWTSIYLAELGYNVWGMDIDTDNYKNACKNADSLGVHVRFSLGDLFTLDDSTRDFVVGFSDGLFEHFDDKDVIQALQIMKSHCKTVIMDVPSWRERNAKIKRGDEIYRRNREWKRLIKQAGFKTKKMYGSVNHCPTWLRYLVPFIIGRSFAPHFSTKVGFVI